jgi:ABC-type uncharacterized transport system permease subunit
MSEIMALEWWVLTLSATVRLGAPLMIAATGELITERAGVLNIGLEGTMLVGAFAAFAATVVSGSLLVGIVTAVSAGAVTGALISFLCVTRRAHQMIVGIVVNITALGLTSLAFTRIWGGENPKIDPVGRWDVPLLSEIPGLGRILFQQSPFFYAAVALVVATMWFLQRTRLGIAITATGEAPESTDATGLGVGRVRYIATMVGCAFGGLAGAALSIGQLSYLSDNVTAGRGFFALAIVLIGRWQPAKVAIAALCFGFAEALQLRLQVITSVPPQLVQMLPYLVAIALMAGFLGRRGAPKALAVPFVRH